MKTLKNISEVINVLNALNARGQFATLECDVPVKLNKFSTSGVRERISPTFAATRRYSVQYHFGESYSKKMAKLLGLDTYVPSADDNKEHIIKGVLMRYKSTNNHCLIYMKTSKTDIGTFVNGVPATDADLAYMKRFISDSKNKGFNPTEYRTVGLKNVRYIKVQGEVYEVSL